MIGQNRDRSSPLRVHAFFEHGGCGQRDREVRESQIPDNDAWHQRRARRIETHIQRVQSHLHRYSRRSSSVASQGKRRAAWCVEMKMAFASLTAAGKFVSRPPSNILQAIHSHNRCGPYHWEYFDPAKHQEPAIRAAAG